MILITLADLLKVAFQDIKPNSAPSADAGCSSPTAMYLPPEAVEEII